MLLIFETMAILIGVKPGLSCMIHVGITTWSGRLWQLGKVMVAQCLERYRCSIRSHGQPLSPPTSYNGEFSSPNLHQPQSLAVVKALVIVEPLAR